MADQKVPVVSDEPFPDACDRSDAAEDLVALIVHDIRAPLTVLSGYLDILGRPLSEDERASALDAGKRAAKRVNELLDDLLSTARPADLLAPRQMVPVRLDEVAAEIVASFSGISDKRFEFVAEADPVVLGDEARIRQAIENLVSNANKYAPAGSRVRVVVGCGDGWATVCVEDEGPGIPEKMRGRVFERSVRLDDGKRGAGLGLYIARTIMESHGGHARVREPENGVGAEFVLEFPSAISEPEEADGGPA